MTQSNKNKKVKNKKENFFCKITKDNVQWLPILYAYDKQFDLINIKENRCWQIKNEREFKDMVKLWIIQILRRMGI